MNTIYKEWQLISKKGVNFEVFFISSVSKIMAPPEIGKVFPLQLVADGYLQVNGNRYMTRADLQKYIMKLRYLVENRINLVMSEYHHYLKLLTNMQLYADKLPQNNFKKFDYLQHLEEIEFILGNSLTYAYNYYFLNEVTADYILNLLKSRGSDNPYRDFEALSQAYELSEVQKEKNDLIKIIIYLKSRKISLNNSSINSKLNKHLRRYAYMGMYYFKGRPWVKKDIVRRLKQYYLTDDLKPEIISNSRRRCETIMKKYSFGSHDRQIVKLIKIVNQATNRYDEANNYLGFKNRNLFVHVSKRLKVSYELLIEMTIDELRMLLKGNKIVNKSFLNELNKRTKNSLLITKKGKTFITTDIGLLKKYAKAFGDIKTDVGGVIHGQAACSGLATGRVVIFKSVSDINKVKKGDIMVAVATVPSFVPAMEKAAAIVTEVGGLLSHAAIVSRELKIPCVVGVDKVTKILKNGSRVVVDANRGIIRKL